MIEYNLQNNDTLAISTRLNEISTELNKIASSMKPSQGKTLQTSDSKDDCMSEINNLVMSLQKTQLQQFAIELAQNMTKSERETYKNRLLDQYSDMSKFIEHINTVSIGDTVFLGHFKSAEDSFNSYVNSCGTDAIEWQVLEIENNKILLLSKYALTEKYFETSREKDLVIWDTCSLRKWLNDYFFKTSFNTDEQAMILGTEILTTYKENTSESVASETNDRVFLLSQNEAIAYFPYEDIRICYSGEIKYDRRDRKDWWTRSGVTEIESDLVYVDIRGRISHLRRKFRAAVRPALWLKKGDIITA